MLDDPPYGDGLKGTMLLSNTDIIEENKKYNDMQIMLVSYNGDYNMLMEADSPESADAWMASIKDHIRFANRDNEDAVLNPEKAQSRRPQSEEHAHGSVCHSALFSVCPVRTVRTVWAAGSRSRCGSVNIPRPPPPPQHPM